MPFATADRAFARTVSDDVIMAVNGHLVFPDGASVRAAIPGLQRTYRSIELHWGDDLRVDPLAPGLAMMATSYHEVQVRATGETVDERERSLVVG